MTPKLFVLAALCPSLVGCVIDPDADPDDLTTTVAAINGPSSEASQFQLRRAVIPTFTGASPTCTGTKVAPGFILTAGRCSYPIGSTVNYFGTGSNSYAPLATANVVARFEVPGSDGLAGDYSSIDNRFSDLALIQVDNDKFGTAATLAWRYPGSGFSGQKVGAGSHDGNSNVNGRLRQVSDTTYSANDNDGEFRTSTIRADEGDQGGPFYYQGRVLGVLDDDTGNPFDTHGRYTSVPNHLAWILETTKYRWSGSQPSHVRYNGTVLEQFVPKDNSELICQYACDTRTDCQAYDFETFNSTCKILGDLTGTGSGSGSSNGALHYAGPRWTNTGDVVGFEDKGVTRVAHQVLYNKLHDLFLGGGWHSGTLAADATAPLPTSKLTAYRRADGIEAVVYRNQAALFESAFYGGAWHAAQLPTPANAFVAGDPAAFITSLGTSMVVYHSLDNHIIMLELTIAGWTARDLTTFIPRAPLASSDPSAFIRSDGYDSIVFRNGTQIFEYYRSTETGRWDWGQPSALVTNAPAPAAVGKPVGYTHHDGTNAIVYRTSANTMEELWLDGFGWHHGGLGNCGASVANGDPSAHVRGDLAETVVFRTQANEVCELENVGTWHGTILASNIVSDPVGYLSGSRSAVVFHKSSQHAFEVTKSATSPTRTTRDMSDEAHENP